MSHKKNTVSAKAEPKKNRLRQFILLALSFIVIYGIYAAGCRAEFKPVVPLYLGLLLVLLTAFIILNRGFDAKPPGREMLPDLWDEERKDAYLLADGRRRKIARFLLFFIIPLLLTFAFDLVYLNFFAGING